MDFGGIVSLIQDQDPDILAFQELTPQFRETALRELEGLYPYHTLSSDKFSMGVGIMSRYKITHITRSSDNRTISANVNSPAGNVFLVNVHAPSKITPFNWSNDWREQREYLENIINQTSPIQEPIILLGDFNITFLSENYSLIRESFQDAFEVSGQGFGFTYPSAEKLGIKLPQALFRIDFIFYNDYLISSETRVIRGESGSDHHPIVSILSYAR
jgi:vancomycin resistance protein VanJ